MNETRVVSYIRGIRREMNKERRDSRSEIFLASCENNGEINGTKLCIVYFVCLIFLFAWEWLSVHDIRGIGLVYIGLERARVYSWNRFNLGM